jgi:hypothetical protein
MTFGNVICREFWCVGLLPTCVAESVFRVGDRYLSGCYPQCFDVRIATFRSFDEVVVWRSYTVVAEGGQQVREAVLAINSGFSRRNLRKSSAVTRY